MRTKTVKTKVWLLAALLLFAGTLGFVFERIIDKAPKVVCEATTTSTVDGNARLESTWAYVIISGMAGAAGMGLVQHIDRKKNWIKLDKKDQA